MKNIRYIDKRDVENLIENKTSNDVVIFLSGPTSQKTPLSVLRKKDVIAVNGSAQYLLSHNIVPFIYVLTDVRFLHQRRDDFYKFSQRSRYTIVNVDVYEYASEEDKQYILNNCLVLRSFYRREKGGFIKKIKFNILSRIHKEFLISVPFSKRGRLVGFCKDISLGYCSCHTVAFAAIQIAYSLKYARIICSGLDLTGSCSRFYSEDKNPMPSELSRDLVKILPFFCFMRENVKDINIYNLSDDTAIQYDIIPFMKTSEIE
ncbi:TPA: 3-deoxy-D-manno-oct-2-ulosonate III transferase WaaZ [Escherichia coli]|nr:3-deoxy-D-manno-oct-2-ulosonate III transferase WaaZ [Escherichia coli]QMD79714.1 3-deoxy-D-manno-oct-2-ulosonate III transferase WaaZ [Escherichia coli]QML58711.1 3-deoxy-D-manno-oct-2-ulosonate III transferase WaaZ [Escherichia coli]HEA3675683.1 3-deoxy-D-manno-oct-2-ulosonate III transferase WaaZ [Escherichia coli]